MAIIFSAMNRQIDPIKHMVVAETLVQVLDANLNGCWFSCGFCHAFPDRCACDDIWQCRAIQFGGCIATRCSMFKTVAGRGRGSTGKRRREAEEGSNGMARE